MAVGSGVGASIGISAETTYGTFVAPTRFLEFESETVEFKPHRVEGKGLYAGGLVTRASSRHTTTATVEGDVKSNVFVKGMGLWLAHTMGSAAIPVQVGATAAYKQTHVLGSNQGMSLSLQKGVPDMGGTVRPYSYTGLKVEQATFECGVDEILTSTFLLDGKDWSEVPTLTQPTYVTGNPEFGFEQGQFLIGPQGSEVLVEGVTKWQIVVKRPLKKNAFYQDGTGRKQAPVQNGMVEISGTLDTEYLDKTKFVDVFRDDVAQSMIVTFTGAAIGTSAYSISFKIPHVRYNSEGPKVGGPDVIAPKLAFRGFYDDVNVPATIEYTSTDTTL